MSFVGRFWRVRRIENVQNNDLFENGTLEAPTWCHHLVEGGRSRELLLAVGLQLAVGGLLLYA